ncbi:MAG: M23 family metallopeptidase [Hormoscilla sp.]
MNKKHYYLANTLLVLLLCAEMNQVAIASDIGLDFEVPNLKDPVLSPVVAAPAIEVVPEKTAVANFEPLEVAAPYFIDRTPPGSYDFTLLRNNQDNVEIPAPCGGTVTHVKYSSQGYGNRVEVYCEESGYAYFMGHLESIAVRIGQKVIKGETLGVQGSTGRSTGPHIHLEIGDRPYLEFNPKNRIVNRNITAPLVYEYLAFVTGTPQVRPNQNIASQPEPTVKQVDFSDIGINFDIPVITHQPQSDIGLNFDTHISEASQDGAASSQVGKIPSEWWEQGSDSPLAIAIGAAEGTRRGDGSKKLAYYWHTDPGNAADNFGTFSYQHLHAKEKKPVQLVRDKFQKGLKSALARLPHKADRRQLLRLKKYHDQLQEQALAQGIELTREELLNGLDLCNQSPAAGLWSGGYIDRLAQMKQLVDDPEEQILEARTWSYWDMEKNSWDAPGLGNNYDSIRRDQQRRYQAIAQAMSQLEAVGDGQK